MLLHNHIAQPKSSKLGSWHARSESNVSYLSDLSKFRKSIFPVSDIEIGSLPKNAIQFLDRVVYIYIIIPEIE